MMEEEKRLGTLRKDELLKAALSHYIDSHRRANEVSELQQIVHQQGDSMRSLQRSRDNLNTEVHRLTKELNGALEAFREAQEEHRKYMQRMAEKDIESSAKIRAVQYEKRTHQEVNLFLTKALKKVMEL